MKHVTPKRVRWQNAAHRLNAEAFYQQREGFKVDKRGASNFRPCEKAQVYIDACSDPGKHAGMEITRRAQATVCNCHGAVDLTEYEYDWRFAVLNTTGTVPIVFEQPHDDGCLAFVPGEVVQVQAWSVKQAILTGRPLEYAGATVPSARWRMKAPAEPTKRDPDTNRVMVIPPGAGYLVQTFEGASWFDDCEYADLSVASQRARRLCESSFPEISQARVLKDGMEVAMIALEGMSQQENLAHIKIYTDIGAQTRNAAAWPGIITLDNRYWPTPEQVEQWRAAFVAATQGKRKPGDDDEAETEAEVVSALFAD